MTPSKSVCCDECKGMRPKGTGTPCHKCPCHSPSQTAEKAVNPKSCYYCENEENFEHMIYAGNKRCSNCKHEFYLAESECKCRENGPNIYTETCKRCPHDEDYVPDEKCKECQHEEPEKYVHSQGCSEYKKKCGCACHENKLGKPYEHDTLCCDAMNGLSEGEGGWERQFLNKWDEPKNNGGFVNEEDAERYANSGQEFEAIQDFIRSEIQKARTEGKEEGRREREKQITGYLDYTFEEFAGKCAACGGQPVEIRSKYPGGEKRKVCPTCLMEIREDCLANLYPNNQACQA